MDCNGYEYVMMSMHNKYAMVISLLKGIENDMLKLENFQCISQCQNNMKNESKKIDKPKKVINVDLTKNDPSLIENFTIDETHPDKVSISNGTRIVTRTKNYMNTLYDSLPEKALRKDVNDNSRNGHYMRYFALSPNYNAILVNLNGKMTLIKMKD